MEQQTENNDIAMLWVVPEEMFVYDESEQEHVDDKHM